MKMIDAVCCVFPDGTVFWTDDTKHGPNKATKAWRSTLSEERKAALNDGGATFGFVMVRMPAEDYYSITATNSPMAMAYVGEPAV